MKEMNKIYNGLNELIATKLMGITCVHLKVILPDGIVANRIQKDWEEDYGEPLSRKVALARAKEDQASEYALYWCGKCYYEKLSSAPNTGTWMVKNYLGDINAAWSIVKKLELDGWYIHIDSVGFNNDIEGRWRTFFMHDEYDDVVEDGDTIEEAICKAALKTVEI